MKERILSIINTVLKNRGKDQIKKIKAKSNFRNDIGFDSLDLAEFTVRMEVEFDIDIFEDGMVYTVGEVMEKLNAR